MTLAVADRVWETSTSTGTGTVVLAGAVTGYRTFSSVIATSSGDILTYYCITDGTNWEVGQGYLSSATQLIRIAVLSSSNANALVNFPAGTKQVFITQPASKAVLVLPNDGNYANTNTYPPAVGVTSTPYWEWVYAAGCNIQRAYYGLRIANSVDVGNAYDISAYAHDTQYGYVTSSTTGYTYGFKSAPTSSSSLVANGSNRHFGFHATGVAPNAGGFRYTDRSYCFYADSSIGTTNQYQFYAAGTDPSYFGGPVGFGSTVTTVSSTATIGYATTAGGTQTQSTNKSTGVTLNKICGQITMANVALAATTSVSFTLTNSTIAATDVVIVNIASAATTNTYTITVDAVAAGSCRIHLRNISATSRTEALVLNFAVIKAVAA